MNTHEAKELLKKLVAEDGRSNPLYLSPDDMGNKYKEALRFIICEPVNKGDKMENIDDLLTHRFQQFAEEIMYLCDEKEDLEYELKQPDLDLETYNGILTDLAKVRINAQKVLDGYEAWKKLRLANTTDG